MTSPAIFVGFQAGLHDQPPIELYNLIASLGHHPIGSTVSRQTLEKHGFTPPPTNHPFAEKPARQPRRRKISETTQAG